MLKPTFWIAVLLIGTGWASPGWTSTGWFGSGVPGVARAQEYIGTRTLTAGPSYTSKDSPGKDGQAGPQFPMIEVVVRLAPAYGATQPVEAGDLSLYSGSTELGRGLSLRSFGDAGYGVKAILALDLSGSMTGAPLEAVRSTIARFVNQARAQDRVEVLTFADDTRVEVPFGADKATLAERLRQVRSRGTETHLYDALLEALAQLDGAPPAVRQLTVISDGHDEGSRHSIDDVIAQAVREKVSIDSIGLTRSHPEFLQMLARISQATAGSYALARSPQELSGLIDQGIRAMRATPVVAFKADKLPADGKTHNLELRWEPQHLKAAVDVQLPLIASPWTVWVWVLAGCFVAGVTLLIISRRQSRRELTVAAQQVEPVREPLPQQAPAEPVVDRSGLTGNEEDKPAGQTPPARAHQPTEVEKGAPAQAPGRAKTRMVAFFDPEQNCPRLEATAGPLAGKSYPVNGEFLIGALDGNDLAIPGDATLSGFHARVRLADQVLTIEDSHSTNGIFVNGVRLGQDRKLLRPNDEIRVGRSVFKVREG